MYWYADYWRKQIIFRYARWILLICRLSHIQKRSNGGDKIAFYHQDEKIETIILTTSLRKWKVNFIVSYNPHTHTEVFLEHLENCLKQVYLKHRTLVVGDFNFDQLSAKGDPLKTLMDFYNFENQIKVPTRVTQGS